MMANITMTTKKNKIYERKVLQVGHNDKKKKTSVEEHKASGGKELTKSKTTKIDNNKGNNKERTFKKPGGGVRRIVRTDGVAMVKRRECRRKGDQIDDSFVDKRSNLFQNWIPQPSANLTLIGDMKNMVVKKYKFSK